MEKMEEIQYFVNFSKNGMPLVHNFENNKHAAEHFAKEVNGTVKKEII